MQLLGHVLCNKGMQKLLALGKQRFQKMRSAKISGQKHCPFDMRFAPHEKRLPSETRQLVYQFLMKLYTEVAEAIPDGLNSNKRPRRGAEYRFDPVDMDRTALRHLPHASIRDFHRQCESENPGKRIGIKLFSDVTFLELISVFSLWAFVFFGIDFHKSS